MLNEKQLKCINLIVGTSKTQKQIAKEVNVTEKTICEWKKQDEFKQEVESSIKESFGSLAVEASKQLGKLLNSKNDFVKIQAVKDVLDRAGYKPIDKKEIKGPLTIEFKDDLDE